MSTLFIAEDDPLMSRMYERAFRLGGHDVVMAGDGEEALTKISAMNPPPAIALLDVMMPKMSGFDLLRKMKADDKLKNIPVILLTNLAGQQDAEKGLQLGAVLYLIKSQYNPKQVVEKIQEVIKASPVTPVASTPLSTPPPPATTPMPPAPAVTAPTPPVPDQPPAPPVPSEPEKK